MKRVGCLIPLVLLVMSAGCSQEEPPAGQRISMTGGMQAMVGPELQFTVPEGWIEEAPTSSMRHSQYRLPGDSGDAELAMFTGIGGSVQQNIDRWIGQFKAPDGSPAGDSAKIEKREVGGFQVTFLDVAGTFVSSMGPMGGSSGPLEDYKMIAAVIETPGSPWFLKLTGPRATVEKWDASFHEFVSSVR